MTILGGLTGRAGNLHVDLTAGLKAGNSGSGVGINEPESRLKAGSYAHSGSSKSAANAPSLHSKTDFFDSSVCSNAVTSTTPTVHPDHDAASCSQTAHRYQELSFRTQPSRRHQNVSFRPSAYRPHFDLNKPSNFFIHLPHSLMEDVPEDITEDQVAFIFRAHEPRHKRRFYISVTSQQYSFTTRLQQLQLLLDQYIPEDEDKTGIYQWHDAFLPAYYKFLFRYTLF